MITGFNTDIEFSGITYHVQTEDKGLSSPIILSLVYDRGTILASKRAPYDDLLHPEFDEKALMERLQKQHKLMCAAIQAGRIEDLKKMTERESRNGKKHSSDPQPDKIQTKGSIEITETSADQTPGILPFVPPPGAEPVIDAEDPDGSSAPIPMPELDGDPFETREIPMVGVISIIEDLPSPETSIDPAGAGSLDFQIPLEAVEVVSDLAGKERPGNAKLSVEILGEEKFYAGETRTFSFMVCRGSGRKVVPDAEIMVKILGSSFRPKIFHTMTDHNGLARIDIELPSFKTGRAALLVRALNNGEEVELRRTISHQ